jgi:hypothetical protein
MTKERMEVVHDQDGITVPEEQAVKKVNQDYSNGTDTEKHSLAQAQELTHTRVRAISNNYSSAVHKERRAKHGLQLQVTCSVNRERS